MKKRRRKSRKIRVQGRKRGSGNEKGGLQWGRGDGWMSEWEAHSGPPST